MLFVHIPKTAGTSFRKGAEAFFGEAHIMKDYGVGSVETSSLVRDTMYGTLDPYEFKKGLENTKVQFMTGHYNLNKYSHVFSIERAVSFVREPVSRVVSEYNHHVNNYGYDKSLDVFYKAPIQQDKQSKILAGVPVEAIGFVGVTENYAESLALINDRFGVKIPNLQLNTGAYSEKISVPDKMKQDILSVNQADQVLYENVQKILSVRLEMHRQKVPYVRGLMAEYRDSRCSGWACFDSSDKPVALEIMKNSNILEAMTAVEWRPVLAALGVGRSGYVGFSFHVGELKPEDSLEVRVQGTGQVLNTAPGFYRGL